MTSQVKQWGKWKYKQKNLCLRVRRWLLLLQKTSEPEQIIVEDIVSLFLRSLVNFCNKRFYRSCQLSLQMDSDEASKQTKCITR